ncbi:MAG: MarR family transcriptional regulator [Ornithinimicrobium sp.]
MPDRRSLIETERLTADRLSSLNLDFASAHAVVSLHRAASVARTHLTNSVLRPRDLTWTGFQVLWVCWIWDRMQTRDVAESVGVSKATLTGVTDTLVARGLVVRLRDQADRRMVALQLTPEGTALMEDLFPEFNRAESQLVRDFDPSQLEQMTLILRHFIESNETIEDA